MNSRLPTTVLLLMFAVADVALPDSIFVNTPNASVQSATYATDPVASDFSLPNTVSAGPSDNPFDPSVGTGSIVAAATATSSAQQNSSYSFNPIALHIDSSAEVDGATYGDINNGGRGHMVGYSDYSLFFRSDVPFDFTLSANTSLSDTISGAASLDVGLFDQFGRAIAFIGTDGAYPGTLTVGTLSGHLPAGNYQFMTHIGVQVDSGNNAQHISDGGSGNYTSTFDVAAPEPASLALFAGGAASFLGFLRRRNGTGPQPVS